MYPILSVVLLMLSLGLVGYPFWKARCGDFEDDGWISAEVVMTNSSDSAIRREKDRVMNTLSEIEFDYHMKKLSYDDYQHLKNDYAHTAVKVLEAEGLNSNLNTPESVRDHQSSIRIDPSQIEREIEEDLRVLSV